MNTPASITHTTPTRGYPAAQLSPDDDLRALATALHTIEELIPRIGKITHSPTRAAYFTLLVEHAHHTIAHAQLIAADLAQRTLTHELPVDILDQLHTLAQDPVPYLSGEISLPDDPRSVPTGRPTFKNTTEYLQNTLQVDFFEASARMETVSHLFAHTDVHGITHPPRFALLAQELMTGNIPPQEVGAAAKRLHKLHPSIANQPDPVVLAERLEAQLAASLRKRNPRGTKALLNSFQSALEQQAVEPSEGMVRSRLGLFYRGQRSGTVEFLLRTRPVDAEFLLSLCAQSDNPRTLAGDREGLFRQSFYGAQSPLPGQSQPPSQGAARHVPTVPVPTRADSSELAPTPEPGSCSEAWSVDPVNPQVFPDFLLAPDETGRPLYTPAELQALTLEDSPPSAEPNALFNDTTTGADGLTRPQRHLQGLLNLLKANAHPNPGRKVTGLPAPQMLIIAHLQDLEAKATGTGSTAHGQRLSPTELRQELCQAGVIPLVMSGAGQVLDVGRARRFFPEYMRQAILARDRGCIVPGCTVPPEHCEIHHVVPWETGGSTSIGGGTPGCSNHHHGFHTGLIKVVFNDLGLPAVILPRFMDPEQKPRRNDYWDPGPQLSTPMLF